MKKTVWITCVALFLISQILFLINIQFPRGHDFDEFHYVPAAKSYVAWQDNKNWEHPPLAKMFMAVGIAAWGDRPIGWRYMSTVFGSLTLVGMYLWALALFGSTEIALWVALLTVVNQLLYVQARIGMLDTFMFAFIAWAMAAFSAFWRSTAGSRVGGFSPRTLLAVTGVCLGLGTACKWFTVIPWALCIGLVILVKVFQTWQATFAGSRESDWYRPRQWEGVRPYDWVLCLGVLPLFVYFLTFMPLLAIQGHSIFDVREFVAMQGRMWDGQGRVVNSHPYMSGWLDWPTIKRPIWYAFDKEGSRGEFVRGVILLGNPLILWSGLVAIVACLWGWVIDRRRDAFLILMTYGAFFFSWAIIPRKVAFFYYYYPAGMVLGLALAYFFVRLEEMAEPLRGPWARMAFLTAAVAVFVYFFPISAALQIRSDAFMKWMWFRSWI